MTVWIRMTSPLLLAIGLTLGAAAGAAGPSVSVPSTPDAAGKVVIRGADIAAGSSVTVRFVNPAMSPIDMVTQVASNGTFVLKFEPAVPGSYAVQVYDSGGQKIGQGNFGYFR